MKKILVCMTICICFLINGCGNSKVINGAYHETFGLFNKEEIKDPNVYYGVIWGNVILGCLLFETIIAPIYFFGFSMWEPICELPEVYINKG